MNLTNQAIFMEMLPDSKREISANTVCLISALEYRRLISTSQAWADIYLLCLSFGMLEKCPAKEGESGAEQVKRFLIYLSEKKEANLNVKSVTA